MENMIARIEQLKQEKDVAIVAHYYVDGQVQDIADYVGISRSHLFRSFQTYMNCSPKEYLTEYRIQTLNPKKTVMMPDLSADCPMAHMVTVEDILDVKEKYPDVAVVCYVNSTAEIKAYSDVCVTSSNAVKVVKALPNKDIFFVPDNNLAHFVAKQTPDKNFIFNDGYCHVHKKITTQHIADAKKRHPGVKVLTHPECTEDVLAVSDFIGSTAEIIDYATKCEDEEFLIATEIGVFHELQKRNPDKKFYPVKDSQICPNMKKITLEKVLNVLETFDNQVELHEEIRQKANYPLSRMLELAK